MIKKIGFEPTFMAHHANLIPIWQYISALEVKRTKFGRRTYLDDGVIEIPSEPISPENIRSYVDELFEFSKRMHIYPSSLAGDEWNGGCHINVSFTSPKIKHDMYRRFKVFIYNNPYICWMFLNSIDNQSSKTTTLFRKYDVICKEGKRFTKTRAILYRKNRIEFRFFEMPKTKDEFIFHLEFLMKLLLLVYSYDQPKKKYTGTLKETLSNIEDLCKSTATEYSDLVKFNKINNLTLRYKWGKKYLN